jgi:predicted NBD/HSP70 family sugar kinase
MKEQDFRLISLRQMFALHHYIGGGVSHAGELLLEPIRRTVRERVTVIPVNQVEVVRSQLGDNAGVIGTACWVVKES